MNPDFISVKLVLVGFALTFFDHIRALYKRRGNDFHPFNGSNLLPYQSIFSFQCNKFLKIHIV